MNTENASNDQGLDRFRSYLHLLARLNLDAQLAGKLDLLTGVMHELGHVLGLDHEAEGAMADAFAAGTRSADGPPLPTHQALAMPSKSMALDVIHALIALERKRTREAGAGKQVQGRITWGIGERQTLGRAFAPDSGTRWLNPRRVSTRTTPRRFGPNDPFFLLRRLPASDR